MDHDALYSQLQPLVRRLIQESGVSAEEREALEALLYERFGDLVRAYDPERGVPLRPYLTRNLSATAVQFARIHGSRPSESGSGLEVPRLDTQVAMESGSGREGHAGFSRGPALPALIAHLPLQQQHVLVWRYYEVRSYEEIAERLEVTPARVRLILRRALQRLRRKIEAIQSSERED